MSSLIVLECNEVPLSIFEWYARENSGSHIGRFLKDGRIGTTVAAADGSGVRDLYPSQTWATLAMGIPFEKHGVYWYGDPKPAEFPLYWQVAAGERRVGIVNTLHSSPFAEQCSQNGLVFALPDVFAMDDDARPTHLGPFQAFTRSMTSKNGRAVRSKLPVKEFASGLSAARRAGVRQVTFGRLTQLVAGVASGRVSKERFRTAQFLLSADVFMSELEAHEPDLAVCFTNHVAAAMHRYWPASFPDDWDDAPYPPDWIEEHRDEIPQALHAFDAFLGRVLRYADQNGATVLIASSMGQVGGVEVEKVVEGAARVVVDPERFGRWLGVPDDGEHASAMVPHVTYRFPTPERAMEVKRDLLQRNIDDGQLVVDQSGDAVTVTYSLNAQGRYLNLDGVQTPMADAGVEAIDVSEGRSGVHDPIGTLMLYGGADVALPDEPVDVLEVAPAILTALGIEPLSHHVEPTFVI